MLLLVDRAGFEPATFRWFGFDVCLQTGRSLACCCQYTRLNYRPTGRVVSLVCLLSLVCGAAAGTFTPCWGGLNPSSRLHWPRLSRAFQACTLPSYVTAATSGVAVSRGISKFPTGPDHEELVRIRLRGFFQAFSVSFVTSIYPFLQNTVGPISMNMIERPPIESRFLV